MAAFPDIVQTGERPIPYRAFKIQCEKPAVISISIHCKLRISHHNHLGRVAKERGMKVEEVRALISRYTDPPELGFLGDAGVNVLRLNLALDGVK